jgi:hypothetical protein
MKAGDLVRWTPFTLDREEMKNPTWHGPDLLVRYDKLMKCCEVLISRTGRIEKMRANLVQKYGKRGLDV